MKKMEKLIEKGLQLLLKFKIKNLECGMDIYSWNSELTS